MKTVRDDEAHGARQVLGDFLQSHANEVTQLEPTHHRGAHGHRARTDTVLLVARQINQLAHPRQRVRQARHSRTRQATTARDFQIAKPCFVTFEAAQNIEGSRHHLNDVALTGGFMRKRSLPAQPLRASPHALSPQFRIAELNSALYGKVAQGI